MRGKKMSQAMVFIVLFGIVSLFSDMTHEGASSIRGAYLALLGASAGTIGFISGLGELGWFLCRNRSFRNFNSLGRRSCKDRIFKIKFKII